MNKRIKRVREVYAVAFSFLFLLVTVDGFARNKRGGDGLDKLPRGCMQEGYNFDYRMLYLHPQSAGGHDSVYFLFNQSGQGVTLRMMSGEKKPNVSLFNNRINARAWGVFSTDMKKVRFICTVRSNKFAYGEVVDCAKHLKVCEFSDVKYGQNNRGNYWMVSSSTRNGAVRRAIRYGVLLSRGHY